MPYLRLLGGAVLEDESGVVTGPAGRRHPLALLAILATSPGATASRGKLVGLLWPDSPERTARNRLNTCLHRLRSSLGREVLLSAGDDLRLDLEALPCDVASFQQALNDGERERAVELYDGSFLDGFALGGSPEFEKWVDRERARLRGRYLEALESLAEAAEARGKPETAVKWWRERAGQDPYDSRVTARLMRALEAAGNRPAALQTARVHAQLLEHEIGTEPSEEVCQLAERMESAPAHPALRSRAGPASAEAPREEPQAEEALETSGRAVPRAGPAGAPVPTRPAAARAPGRNLLFGLPVALGLVAAAVAAVWFLLAADGPDGTNPHAGSVAVLPFETIGEDEANPFTQGLQLGLLTRLSKLPELSVLSEESVARLRAAEEPLPQAAARFGIGWIVRGDVQQVGDRVQVSARLVDARQDRQVWAETYGAGLSAGNLFEIQGQIVRQIADALEIRLGPDASRRITAVPTEHTAAYELYLQGEELVRLSTSTSELLEQRIVLYRRALELDPEFADAWARLAHAYVIRMWTGEDPRAWADSALRAARKALQLDPESAEAHTQIGNVHATMAKDVEASVDAYRRALELEPSHGAAANNLVVTLALRGRLADALRFLDRAYRLSPNFHGHLGSFIKLNAQLGRDEVAAEWIAHARSHRPDAALHVMRSAFDVELLYRGRPDRARAVLPELVGAADDQTIEVDRRRAALALYEGRWTEARRTYRSFPPDVRGGSLIHFHGLLTDDLGLAHALERLGDRDEARAIAAEVARTVDPDAAERRVEHQLTDRLAVAHLILGDTAAALDWLERSVDAGLRDAGTLRTLPLLEPLRDHPRFRALLERIDALVAEERRRADEGGWGLPPAS